MPKRKRFPSFFIILSLVALIAIAGIVLYIVFSAETVERNGIILPSSTPSQSSSYDLESSDTTVTVTKENLSSVVKSLARPTIYRQSLQIIRSNETYATTEAMTLSVCGTVAAIQTARSEGVCNYLTDGQTIYTWYDDDRRTVSEHTLPASCSMDELASVPTYESLFDISAEKIQTAEYRRSFDATSAPCIYAEVQLDESCLERYWVDCSTGLLCKAEQAVDGNICLSVTQTALDVYSAAEISTLDYFKLPDGTMPFEISAAAQTQAS